MTDCVSSFSQSMARSACFMGGRSVPRAAAPAQPRASGKAAAKPEPPIPLTVEEVSVEVWRERTRRQIGRAHV